MRDFRSKLSQNSKLVIVTYCTTRCAQDSISTFCQSLDAALFLVETDQTRVKITRPTRQVVGHPVQLALALCEVFYSYTAILMHVPRKAKIAHSSHGLLQSTACRAAEVKIATAHGHFTLCVFVV